MALSEELKKVYSSNPIDVKAYDTIEITHSQFSQPYYLIKNNEDMDLQLEDLSVVTFQAFPFSINLPEVGNTQQDISFVFDNVGRIGMPELEAAANVISEPIKLTYRVYIDGTNVPQTAPINLVLTNIVATATTISAIATRSDLFKRMIPSGNNTTFDERFPGLFI